MWPDPNGSAVQVLAFYAIVVAVAALILIWPKLQAPPAIRTDTTAWTRIDVAGFRPGFERLNESSGAR